MRRLLFALSLAALVASGSVSTALAAEWRVPGDFATIQAAIDSPAVAAGDVILVGPGSHAGALVTKAVDIRGEGRAVINTGPVHPSGKTRIRRSPTGAAATGTSRTTRSWTSRLTAAAALAS
jgi:pectin methylesterase-like acyl-CoA thioesterase